MRLLKATLLMLALVLMAPVPAHAWFDWLDNLSGPGPFSGLRFDYTIACFMDQPSDEQTKIARANARLLRDSVAGTIQVALQNLPQAPPVNPPQPPAQDGLQFRAPAPPQPPRLTPAQTLQAAIIKLGAIELEKPIPGAPKKSGDELRRELKEVKDVVDQVDVVQGLMRDVWSASSQELQTLTADLDATKFAWKELKKTSREAKVHPVSKPSIWFFASCTDRLQGNPDQIQHRDRHPVISIVLNYRELTNATFLHFSAEESRDDANSVFAEGKPIHLRILEPKVVWPLSGHFDFLDGQAGAGIYWFNSAGFKPGRTTFSGLTVEPIRFDLHAPGRLADGINNANCAAKFARRLLLSFSYSAGVLLFPRGFAADDFNAVGPAARGISGGEAIFEQGLVINVGRLFGQ